jgi:hypothetical protein
MAVNTYEFLSILRMDMRLRAERLEAQANLYPGYRETAALYRQREDAYTVALRELEHTKSHETNAEELFCTRCGSPFDAVGWCSAWRTGCGGRRSRQLRREPTHCVRCGSPFMPAGNCSRRDCQGGRGEA